jgi:competence ComEA-like helix-hairpin-helix protein
MPHRPLLILLALAVLGHGVRLALVPEGAAAGAVTVIGAGPSAPASAAAHRDSITALSRPLAIGERVNVDRAPVPEIARLPRVGVALAKRIAADRASRGPFGSLAGLDRVPGIGPGLLRVLEPHVAFEPGRSAPGGQAELPVAGRCIEVPSLTGGQQAPPCGPERLSLNQATAAQLDSLPGIGPARAAAIVRYRNLHGPFATVENLDRVPGINPALMQRLSDRLQVP